MIPRKQIYRQGLNMTYIYNDLNKTKVNCNTTLLIKLILYYESPRFVNRHGDGLYLRPSFTLLLITTELGSFHNLQVHLHLGFPRLGIPGSFTTLRSSLPGNPRLETLGSTLFILASSLRLALGFPGHLFSELSRLFLTKIIQNHQKSSSILAICPT